MTYPVFISKDRPGPRIGYCIYCGDDKGRLTREHALPVGLNGNRTLLDATCDECKKLTNDLETKCLRGAFRDYRYRHNFRSRHKDDRPTALPLGVGEYNSDSTILIPVDEHPGMLVLPHLDGPGILRGLTVAESSREPDLGCYLIFNNPSDQLISQHGDVWTSTMSSTEQICQLVAKIAYCCVVWERPSIAQMSIPIKDLIRGKNNNLARYLVGNMKAPVRQEGAQHNIGTIALTCNGKQWLGGFVQLFANHGGPTYLAAICENPAPEHSPRILQGIQ